jgi:hypothetical protein
MFIICYSIIEVYITGRYIYYLLFTVPNKNVEIKFSAHDAFLELPLPGTLKIDRVEIM